MRPTTRERGRRLNNDTGDTKMRPAAKDATWETRSKIGDAGMDAEADWRWDEMNLVRIRTRGCRPRLGRPNLPKHRRICDHAGVDAARSLRGRMGNGYRILSLPLYSVRLWVPPTHNTLRVGPPDGRATLLAEVCQMAIARPRWSTWL
jgi:hypothetical protein